MDIGDYLREPLNAAIFAALVTAAYVHIKAKMNNEGKLQLSQYIKPAFLVGLLVYFIVSNGSGTREKISSEPF
jgi:Na+/pantothenate symporter